MKQKSEYTPMFPKPHFKKKHAQNNPVPTINDRCRYDGTPYAQTHEVYGGSGRRQLSIQYGMQVKLCDRCHKEVTYNPKGHKSVALKQEFQIKFEENHTRDEFRKIFGKSYLEE